MALVKETLNTAINTKINTDLNPLLKSAFTTIFKQTVTDAFADITDPTPAQSALKVQLEAKAVVTAQTWATNLTPQIATAVSAAVSDAVDAFIRMGTVTTPLGIPVSTVGTAAAQTGATTAPGIGTIS